MRLIEHLEPMEHLELIQLNTIKNRKYQKNNFESLEAKFKSVVSSAEISVS